MKVKNNNSINTQSGQVIIGALLLFLTISITVLVGIATPVAIQVRTASDFLQSKQGYIAADVLNEEALYRLNKGYTLPGNLVLSFNDATSTAIISDLPSGAKQVLATGISGTFTRLSQSVFNRTEGLNMAYALQAGLGGLIMSGSPTVNGTVVSNGDITGSGVSTINGSANAAVVNSQTVDQSNGSGVPAVNTQFGTANASQDFAQSFRVSTTTPVSRIMVYIRKNGSPGNITARITPDSSGNPAGSTLLSGTVNATQVTTTYGWAPVMFTTDVSLTPGTTYWLVLDVSSNSTTNNYTLGVSNTNSYANGVIKLGRYNVSNSWTAQNTNNDAFFEIYVGGMSTISGVVVNGSASAYAISNSTISGTAFCQTGSGNNKACNTSSSTPTTVNYPFSETNISDWKAQATAGGTYTGNITLANIASTTTGPLKIVGNLTITDAAKMYIKGPIYVTGDITLAGDTDLLIDSSVGSKSVPVIADGNVVVGNSANASGNGNSGSYLILVSTSNCGGLSSCGTTPAIRASGAAGAVVFLAPNGRITFDGSATAKAIAGHTISMEGATVLNYESGLSAVTFDSSSGGSSSWITDTWKEISQ